MSSKPFEKWESTLSRVLHRPPCSRRQNRGDRQDEICRHTVADPVISFAYSTPRPMHHQADGRDNKGNDPYKPRRGCHLGKSLERQKTGSGHLANFDRGTAEPPLQRVALHL